MCSENSDTVSINSNGTILPFNAVSAHQMMLRPRGDSCHKRVEGGSAVLNHFLSVIALNAQTDSD